jgi:hypothetical protein
VGSREGGAEEVRPIPDRQYVPEPYTRVELQPLVAELVL